MEESRDQPRPQGHLDRLHNGGRREMTLVGPKITRPLIGSCKISFMHCDWFLFQIYNRVTTRSVLGKPLKFSATASGS